MQALTNTVHTHLTQLPSVNLFRTHPAVSWAHNVCYCPSGNIWIVHVRPHWLACGPTLSVVTDIIAVQELILFCAQCEHVRVYWPYTDPPLSLSCLWHWTGRVEPAHPSLLRHVKSDIACNDMCRCLSCDLHGIP